MKILVTGGAGFLGTNICKSLVEKKHSVICVDNLVTASSYNVTFLKTLPGLTFIHQDIATNTLEDLGEVDQIYHLACPASPPAYQAIPVQTLLTSALGTHHVISFALKKNKKLLFSSTSEVYGDPKEHPQKETYWGNVNPIGFRSCYDEGKRFAESLIFAYIREKNLKASIVRIFNTYGPFMRPDDGRVVSNFITQALVNKPITIYGDGSQTRSFCFVDDLIDGLFRLMDSTETGPINLGNPQENTILELAQTIVQLTGSTSTITYKDLPLDDPIKRNPDITQAREKLHWQPSTLLEKGLEKTITWYKKILHT